MAISGLPTRRERRAELEWNDPILEKLATTNTFDSDWETLRHHLHVSLLSTLPVFLSIGPPRPYRSPQSPVVVGPEPIKFESSTEGTEEEQTNGDGDKPPAESLLLSPSAPTSSSALVSTPGEATTGSSLIPGSIDDDPTATPSVNRLEGLLSADDLHPSTPGGLVIPPFPPLEPGRRRRSTSSESSGPSTTITLSPNPRMNGMRHQQRVISVTPGVLDDEYDEEVVIGGKMLPGWLAEEEAKKEIDRVAKILDDLDAPPFTIQRLAELLLQPTQYHTSIGKYLRAVEKTLLVTTTWEPPSYVPQPDTFGLVSRTAVGGSTSSAQSDNGYDSDSTMPPGSTTPMFSPIPFLTGDRADSELGLSVNVNDGQPRSLDDGLMSPLTLNDGDGLFGSSANPRSPTPEPEETGDGDTEMRDEREQDVTSSPSRSEIPPRPPAAQGRYESAESETGIEAGPSDPAHQSYLGRVDELDTGPIPNAVDPTSASTTTTAPDSARKHEMDEMPPAQGTGEGGTMTPHGMSERPVPISSTTVVKDDKERHIAGLPRTTSEKSLRDRFVSAGAASDETDGESGAAAAAAAAEDKPDE